MWWRRRCSSTSTSCAIRCLLLEIAYYVYHDIGIHAISSVLKFLFALLDGSKERGTDIGSCRKQSKLDELVNHGKQSPDLYEQIVMLERH